MVNDRIDWREDALCSRPLNEQHAVTGGVSAAPDDFFHIDPTTRPGRRHIARCLAVCNACPVKAECMEYALLDDPDPRWAIIGGLLPSEIKEFRDGKVA